MLCQTAILMPFFLCTIVLDMIDVNILIYIITRCYITMTIYFTEIKEYDCYILFFCSQTTSSEVCTGEKFDGGVRRRFGAWLYHPRVPLPWGDTSDTSEGSEHTVNSIRYPMEVVTKIKLFFFFFYNQTHTCLYFIPLILFLVQMHIVSKKKDLTLDQALQAPDGLAVLGFFIEVKLGQVKLWTTIYVLYWYQTPLSACNKCNKHVHVKKS